MNNRKTSVSPIIYNNGNRNLTTLFNLNVYANNEERRQDMKANIDKIKNLIIQDEDLINSFIIIAMHYASQTEGEEETINFEDYKFYTFISNSYYKKDKYIEEYLSKEENTKFKGLVESYYYLFNEKEKIINSYNISKMLLQYYFLRYFENIEMYNALLRMLYLAHKNKGTKFEDIIKRYVLSYINYERLKEKIDDNKEDLATQEKRLKYYKKANAYYILKNFYIDFSKDGKLSHKTLLEIVNGIAQDEYYYFDKWEKDYFNFLALFEGREDIEEVRKQFVIKDNIDDEILRKIKEHIEDNVKEATNYNEIKKELLRKLEEIGKQENVDITLSEEETKMLSDKLLNAMKETSEKDMNTNANITDLFIMLSFSEDIKDYLINNTVVEYANKDEIKEEYKDRYKTNQKNTLTEDKPKKKRKKDRLAHNLTEEMITTSNEWVKVNNSKYSRGILDVRDEIATYQETDLERQEKELKELEARYNKNPNKSLEEEIEDKKADILENKKNFEILCNSIEEKETELADLRRLYADADDEGKKSYLTLLKKKDKEVKELKKKRDSRGFSTQLDLFSNKLKVENKEVTLSIDYSKFDITNYTSEGKRLLVYMQNQLYYNPTNEYIIVDLDEYLDQTGRKLSTARIVRGKIEKSLQSMYDESYKLHLKDDNEGEDRELEGQIRLIQEYWQDKYKGKKTYYIKPSDAYKKILLNEKSMKWASIPLLLNRLNGTRAEDRAREIGFYLYQQLRNDLKNQKVGYNYNKKFKVKTLVDLMRRKGLNNNYEAYAKNFITPLEDALNKLEDLGFIEYHTKAFLEYEGYYNEENNEFIKGTLGSSENNIRSTFEEADLLITYKIADYEEYDRIINKRAKKIPNTKKKDK